MLSRLIRVRLSLYGPYTGRGAFRSHSGDTPTSVLPVYVLLLLCVYRDILQVELTYLIDRCSTQYGAKEAHAVTPTVTLLCIGAVFQ